jgi:hypothetical protein
MERARARPLKSRGLIWAVAFPASSRNFLTTGSTAGEMLEPAGKRPANAATY